MVMVRHLLVEKILGQGPGRGAEQMQHCLVARREAASFGRMQALLGQLETRQVLECLMDAVEPFFETRAEGREGRCATVLRAHCGEWVGEELVALVVVVGHAVGGDQGQGLAVRQAMLFGRGTQGLLIGGLDGAQGMSQSRADGAGVEALGHGRSQVLGKGHAVEDPAGFLATQTGDGRGREPLLGAQGIHHTSLVHGGDGASRAIGAQHGHLALGLAREGLDHDGDPRRTRSPPAC